MDSMLIDGEYGGSLIDPGGVGRGEGVSRGFEVGMEVGGGLILGIELLLLVVPGRQSFFPSIPQREVNSIVNK